ncbi:MAG: hypothetical protein RLP44_27795 [Aggregatilineales bacterium]
MNFNEILNYIDKHSLELKFSLVGNKYLRFNLAVNKENQFQEFISEIGNNISVTEWVSISQDEFESITLIEHAKNDRTRTLKALEIIHQYTYQINAFYQQVYDSNSNNVYLAIWTVNKRGLDERIIEKAFDIVEQSENVRMAYHENGNAIQFYIVAQSSYPLNKIISAFPPQLRHLEWREIESEQLPDKVGANPNNLDANIFSIWREGLYSMISN